MTFTLPRCPASSGWPDEALMRVTDAFQKLPNFLLLLVLVLVFGSTIETVTPPIIVYAYVIMAVSILLESALAYLSLSDPNVPPWSNLIGAGRACCGRNGTSPPFRALPSW